MRAARKRPALLDFALAAVLAVVVVFAGVTGAAGQPAAGTAVLVLGAVRTSAGADAIRWRCWRSR